MSSTNKTENLQLNSWIGSDIPKREDFNNDNLIIDAAISSHENDADIHTTSDEKKKWNNTHTVTTYAGNGLTSRTINVASDFSPSFVLVFAQDLPPSVSDMENYSNYNYFGIASISGCTSGLSLSGKALKVQQSPTPVSSTEYKSFNETGATYICIAIR